MTTINLTYPGDNALRPHLAKWYLARIEELPENEQAHVANVVWYDLTSGRRGVAATPLEPYLFVRPIRLVKPDRMYKILRSLDYSARYAKARARQPKRNARKVRKNKIAQ